MTKKKNQFVTVISLIGRSIKVDISDEACEPFGFKHGDRFRSTCGEGAVMGVAHKIFHSIGPLVLWVRLDSDPKGRAGFYENPKVELQKI